MVVFCVFLSATGAPSHWHCFCGFHFNTRWLGSLPAKQMIHTFWKEERVALKSADNFLLNMGVQHSVEGISKHMPCLQESQNTRSLMVVLLKDLENLKGLNFQMEFKYHIFIHQIYQCYWGSSRLSHKLLIPTPCWKALQMAGTGKGKCSQEAALTTLGHLHHPSSWRFLNGSWCLVSVRNRLIISWIMRVRKAQYFDYTFVCLSWSCLSE